MPKEGDVIFHCLEHCKLICFFKVENETIKKSYSKQPYSHEKVHSKNIVREKTDDLLFEGLGCKIVENLYTNGINVFEGVIPDKAQSFPHDFINGNLKFEKNSCSY